MVEDGGGVMRLRLVPLAVLVGVVVPMVMSVQYPFHCPPCEKIHCTTRKLKCKGGLSTQVCGCCPACAKVEGERCGGYKDYQGKCDRGLKCVPTGGDSNSFWKKSAGICVEVVPEVPVEDEGMKSYCEPLCAPEFCRKSPKAICSAASVAESNQPCQDDCQHTSCSACYFQTQLDCVKCAKGDYSCLRRFGKCIKRDTCSRRKFPCRRRKFNEIGKFVCKVPGCLD
ncbi:hypothetical protein ScPMuIL_017630 [Solemya velum]